MKKDWVDIDQLDYMVAEDDYCSMAERRTDE